MCLCVPLDRAPFDPPGWKPKISWAVGLRQTVEWYLEHGSTQWDARMVSSVMVAHPRIGDTGGA